MRVAVMLLVASGVAQACPQSTYVARVGTLSHAAHCGEWIATTDPWQIDRSLAVIKIRAATPAEFSLAVRIQQLTPEPAALEIEIPGGFVVLRDGGIGLFTSEAAWSEHGMELRQGPRLTDGMDVRVRAHGDIVEAWVDGAHAGTWTVPARPVTDLELAIVGPGGRRARLWFSELVDTPR